MTTEINTVHKPSKMMAGAFAALTLALAGCASGYGANTVSPNAVGYQTQVRSGVVTSYREVQIKAGQSWIGAATGAVRPAHRNNRVLSSGMSCAAAGVARVRTPSVPNATRPMQADFSIAAAATPRPYPPKNLSRNTIYSPD